MLDHFLNTADAVPYRERTAYQLAWRPAGARPLLAALAAAPVVRPPVTRPPAPTFELR